MVVAQTRVLRRDQTLAAIWNIELIEVANRLDWEVKKRE